MNEAFMLLRRRRVVIEVLPEHHDSAQSSSEPFIDQSPSPEESCWRRERVERLTAAIDRLDPKIRTTVLLHKIEERSAEDTAQILGISIAAVKARVFQARRKLRRTLNSEHVIGAYGTPRSAVQC
jgi:RNA polymerase sigma-70 factor (ECF subfamily)